MEIIVIKDEFKIVMETMGHSISDEETGPFDFKIFIKIFYVLDKSGPFARSSIRRKMKLAGEIRVNLIQSGSI